MKITICNHDQHFNSKLFFFLVKKKKRNENYEASQCVKKHLKKHLQWKVRKFPESNHSCVDLQKNLCAVKKFQICFHTMIFFSSTNLLESGLETKGSNPHQPAWQTSQSFCDARIVLVERNLRAWRRRRSGTPHSHSPVRQSSDWLMGGWVASG